MRLLPRASRNFGGKARNLAALVRAGFPVPLAYALSSEAAAQTFARVLPRALQPAQLFARPFVPGDAICSRRANACSAPSSTPSSSTSCCACFGALRAAAAESVAVRSSSTVEDLSAASAAGLHTSVLDVCSDEQLFDAVRECFAARVLAARRAYLHASASRQSARSAW